MTTSFTTSDEFDPQGGGFDGEPDYPEAFGVTFTPKIIGIILGVLGTLIAAYLISNQVLPAWKELSELKIQRQEKEGQLNQLNSNQLEVIIAQKRAELEQTQNLKQEVIQLFSSDNELETLLLDVSNFAELTNVTINSYVPTGEKEPLTDESLGSLATNNVQVKTYNLDLEGTFSELQSFLQDLERLQPLLIVKNLNADTVEPPKYLLQNNQLSAVGQPTLKTTVTFQAVFADVKPPVAEQPPVEGETP